MKNVYLALALALLMSPAAALADNGSSAAAMPPGPPGATPAQRAAMMKTLQTFGEKERQLHQQMRTHILDAISAEHRAAVATVIGQLAISPTPDAAAAAKQIDAILSDGERQNVLAARTSCASQSRALRETMRTQLAGEMPAWPQGSSHGPMAWPMGGPGGPGGHMNAGAATDAGTTLLMVLSHAEPFGMGQMPMGHPQP